MRPSYDLTCESLARISVPHAIVQNLTMIQEDIVRAEYDTAAGHAPLFAMPFHSAVQITVRSSTTQGLERRLVRFLRLHRDTLPIFVSDT